MTAKTVIRTQQATQDVERELDHYLEDSQQAALGLITEIEQAYARIGKHPHVLLGDRPVHVLDRHRFRGLLHAMRLSDETERVVG
jgi:plasmid stabilization system protein ParE